MYSKRVEEVLNKTTSLAGGLASEDLESLAQAPEDDAAKLDEDEEVDAAAKEEVKTKRRVRCDINVRWMAWPLSKLDPL